MKRRNDKISLTDTRNAQEFRITPTGRRTVRRPSTAKPHAIHALAHAPCFILLPALFSLDPEDAHGLTLSGLDLAQRLGLLKLLPRATGKPLRVMGIDFPNAVGLAAGMDKDGAHINALAALGFGFIEIGTVTPRPQSGNPKPRLFRLPQARPSSTAGFSTWASTTWCVTCGERVQGLLGIA
jgi:hypothetical protein